MYQVLKRNEQGTKTAKSCKKKKQQQQQSKAHYNYHYNFFSKKNTINKPKFKNERSKSSTA